MSQKYHIYKITNTINSKIYIGRTGIGIKTRMKHHQSRYKSKTYSHLRLYRAFEKYGFEQFKIESIFECSSFEEAQQKEHDVIMETESYKLEKGYNMCVDTYKGLAMLDADVLMRRGKSLRDSAARKKIMNGQLIGVGKPYKTAKSWRASFLHNGNLFRQIFKSENEAAMYYDQLAFFYHGDDAILNFPEKKALYQQTDIQDYVSRIEQEARLKRTRPLKNKVIGIIYHKKHDKWAFSVYNKTTGKRLCKTIFGSEMDAVEAQQEFLDNNPDYRRSSIE